MTNYVPLKAVAACALVPLWSPSVRRRVEAFLDRNGFAAGLALFAASRLAAILAAFALIGFKFPQDAVEWSEIITQPGKVSPYSPGFDALLTGLWRVAPSPLSFIVAMSSAEVVAFGVFWRGAVGRVPSASMRALLAFWLVNPMSLFHITLGGQDESLILLAWCAVAWAVVAGRPMAGGLGAAVGVVCSKLLAGFACLPLLALPAKRMAAGLAVGLAALGAGVLTFTRFKTPVDGFLTELAFPTSGNVWEMLELLGLSPGGRPVLFGLGVAAVTMVGLAVVLRRHPMAEPLPQMLRVSGTIGCAFLLTSPKSPTAWMVMFLPGILFLVLTLAPPARRLIATVFLPVSVFEPSLWFYFDKGSAFGDSLWARPVMLMADAVLIAGYLALIRQGLQLAATAGESCAGERRSAAPSGAALGKFA